MQYVSLRDQVDYILSLAELPDTQHVRVLRLLSATLDDLSWITFPQVCTEMVTLDDGLRAPIPRGATLVSKIGLLTRSGNIAVLDIVSDGMDFVRRGRGKFDPKSHTVSTNDVPYIEERTTGVVAAITDGDGNIDGPIYPFLNFQGNRYLRAIRIGSMPRAVIRETDGVIILDGKLGVEPGQKLFVEFVPRSVTNAEGFLVIPTDARAMIAYAVLEQMYLVKAPGQSEYYNRKFVEARNRYRRKHTDMTLGDVIGAFRKGYSQAVRY